MNEIISQVSLAAVLRSSGSSTVVVNEIISQVSMASAATPIYSNNFKDLAVCILSGDSTAALDVLEDLVPADYAAVSDELKTAIYAEDNDASEDILRENYPDLVKMCVCVPMNATATEK